MTAPSPQVDGAGPAAPRPLRVATRRSALALAQSRAVGEQLATLTGRPLELVEVTTQGDVDRGPLAQIGGTGVFVAAVREAVAEGRADVAVHSLKDLPTAPDPRLELAAVPLREDPRDALVAGTAATLAELPTGARVGTGSPRRRAQLAAIRPDLELVDLRDNVDTRLGQVRGRGVDAAVAAVAGAAGAAAAPAGTGRTERRPDLDAVVLATAGLSRLDRADRISEHLDPDVMLPAPGQGALAIEARAELVHPAGANGSRPDPLETGLLDALRAIDDSDTRAAVTAERTVLATLQAGCSAPVGALAEVRRGASQPTLHLRAVLATADGTLVRCSASGPVDLAESLGRSLALDLLADPSVTAGQAISGASTGPATTEGSPTR